MFKYLFLPSDAKSLTVKAVTTLLKPKFSEEGCNSRIKENEIYTSFLKYLREVASKCLQNACCIIEVAISLN